MSTTAAGDPTMMLVSAFDILGLPSSCRDVFEAKLAWRRMIKATHPDGADSINVELFRSVHEAWHIVRAHLEALEYEAAEYVAAESPSVAPAVEESAPSMSWAPPVGAPQPAPQPAPTPAPTLFDEDNDRDGDDAGSGWLAVLPDDPLLAVPGLAVAIGWLARRWLDGAVWMAAPTGLLLILAVVLAAVVTVGMAMRRPVPRLMLAAPAVVMLVEPAALLLIPGLLLVAVLLAGRR